MSWKPFLEMICREYNLTSSEVEILMCLEETTREKKDLFTACNRVFHIAEDTFTQRLRSIYKKFKLGGRGYKLLKLNNLITDRYKQHKSKNYDFSEVGLTYIHSNFPRDKFAEEIERVINSDDRGNKEIAILQTFAPNLNDYYEHFIRCIQNNIQIRILLAWPYSKAAELREDVLIRYDNSLTNDFNIRDSVIANLETLERVLNKVENKTNYLEIRLYDTLPSSAIYQAGNYMLAGFFFHGSLAVNTFQLELNLNTPNHLIVKTLKSDFELTWKISRRFYPEPNHYYPDPDGDQKWRNDLRKLFTDR
jgi:hypothetical protein